jgi:prepilin-type N-terminal cleavage/methylation domain-containing protein
MKKPGAGFTIIELTLVLAIGGILLMSADMIVHAYLQEERTAVTQTRLAAIDAALGAYLANYGAYPCPASLTSTVDTSTYGVDVTGGKCDTVAAVPPQTFSVASAGAAPNNGKFRIGAVPVRTLNLPDQDMADAWNNRFYYAVTESLASASDAGGNPYNSNNGSIGVVDSLGNNVATFTNTAGATVYDAQYIIISTGPDGVGAFPAAGGAATPPLACPAAAATLEALNCRNAGNNGTFRKTTLNGNAGGFNIFDDFVIFHTTNMPEAVPAGATALFAGAACPQGWATPNPPLANVGGSIYCSKI